MNTESGFCYVVVFSNGFIKGGKSGDIFKRYKTHKATATALGISVKRAFYTEPHSEYHSNEKRLLSALSAVSEERVGEFFRGTSEDSAIEVLCSLGLEISLIEECILGMMSQDALLALAKDKELTLAPKNVLLYLLSQLDFENFIQVPQVEIANALDMDKAKVSKAIKLLLEKGVLIRGPKLARSSSFRLNPNFGYKGNPSGKVYRTVDGRRAFRVVDDDGYVIPQEPAPDYPPKPSS
jgi:predicted transcriptional regulator